MGDTPTLVRFTSGYAEDGLSEDGLPNYRETIKITKSRPPYLQITQVATEEDFSAYPEALALFRKEQAAKKAAPVEGGFPLSLWAAIGPAELMMLAARDVTTIEQLAKMRVDDRMPGSLRELAERAKAMTELSSKIGKFEGIIRTLEGEKQALSEQVRELQNTVKAQDGIINSLKPKVA